jgi:hypothetical protein
MLDTSGSLRNRMSFVRVRDDYLCVLGNISPIKELPDEILLTIFDFCRVAAMGIYEWPGRWP